MLSWRWQGTEIKFLGVNIDQILQGLQKYVRALCSLTANNENLLKGGSVQV